MGMLYKAVCGCGYVCERIAAGCGLGAENEAMIKRGVPEELYSAFCEERERGELDSYVLGNAVAVCGKCREIRVVSRFSRRYTDGREEVYVAACPECGGALSEAEDISRLPCPRCGKIMNLSEIGFWD